MSDDPWKVVGDSIAALDKLYAAAKEARAMFLLLAICEQIDRSREPQVEQVSRMLSEAIRAVDALDKRAEKGMPKWKKELGDAERALEEAQAKLRDRRDFDRSFYAG